MAVCGLRDLFEFVVCGDQVVRGKPHPEPVLTAMAALNIHLDPTRVLFVGDSPNDLRAGKSAGTKTAAVGWGPIDHRVLNHPTTFWTRWRTYSVSPLSEGLLPA